MSPYLLKMSITFFLLKILLKLLHSFSSNVFSLHTFQRCAFLKPLLRHAQTSRKVMTFKGSQCEVESGKSNFGECKQRE